MIVLLHTTQMSRSYITEGTLETLVGFVNVCVQDTLKDILHNFIQSSFKDTEFLFETKR